MVDRDRAGSGRVREQIAGRARQLIERAQQEEEEWSVLGMTQREIALTVDELDRVQDVVEEQRRSLLRVETYTNTELMQMEQRTPRYSTYRFPEREKLQRRLMKIEEERRQLLGPAESDVARLHSRLLTLLERHAQLADK